MKTYYIGADVHKQSTTIAVRQNKKIITMTTLPTQIDKLIEFLDQFQGCKHLAIEESSLAAWLHCHLHDKVDKLIFCDPRRNRLICDDGDKDDPIDAVKLTELLAHGSLRQIHHSANERHLTLKQWTALYYDRVREKVRQNLKIQSCALQHGIHISSSCMVHPARRKQWLREISPRSLAKQLCLLFSGLDVNVRQVAQAQEQMLKHAQNFPIIRKWQKLPGIGPIRAITLYAYLETPWRFKTKSKLFKYCGVGLERSQSGADRRGRPKPARLKLSPRCNRILKNVVIGAARSIIDKGDNVFQRDYERMVAHGMSHSKALHALARKVLTVIWGMWKSQRSFDPHLGQASNGLC
jgi:transposase